MEAWEWEFRRTRFVICVCDCLQAMKEVGRRASPDIKQIDIDVLRTFRDNIMYKDRYGIKSALTHTHTHTHTIIRYSLSVCYNSF